MRNILVNKHQKHEVNRPLVHFVMCYIIGIIGGNTLFNKQSVSLFFYSVVIITVLCVYSLYYGIKSGLKCIVYMTIGCIMFLNFPIHQEEQYFMPNTSYQIEGEIIEVKETDYYKWLTLKSVKEINRNHKLKSKVQLRVPLDYNVSPCDRLKARVSCMEIEPQMNPSDLDYRLYLKGQQIAATFKIDIKLSYEVQTPWIEKLQKIIRKQLDKLFSKDKVGIMEALTLGDDTKLDKEIKNLYQATGISHVLCISGFHVGVMIGAAMILCGMVCIPYTLKQLLLIGIVIGYVMLTGGATSTVRAAIMIIISLIGKCLWQEDDGITNVAVAAVIILVMNPYQLFMVGFQLSFVAVIAVILCSNEMEKKVLYVEWKYTYWQRTLAIWSSVQLLTWPIIAYHFFEVPFTTSLLNLIIIPIFSIIIIVGWWLVLFSFMPLPVAYIGSWFIEVLLENITKVVTWATRWPLASVCTGRPSLITYILYFSIVILLGRAIWGYCKKTSFYQGLLAIGCCYSMGLCMQPKTLKITSLYVGQGDCSVIEMPGYGVFVIDGGNFGNGAVIEKYIKYLGYDEIQGMMISHSDSDHIGGLLEILALPIEIGQVFISETDASSNLQTFKLGCEKENIPIYSLSQGEQFKYGDMQFYCMAPIKNEMSEDHNNNSIVCKFTYGNFKALFTGDQSKELCEFVCKDQDAITLLKVSHHGSRTGTSKGMLLKLQPKYAMISCGMNNRYGHPHKEVIALLEAAAAEVDRTDREGAICYETDGKYIKKTSYRKDA